MTEDTRSSVARAAAVAGGLLLMAIICFHIYWALGDAWALHSIGHVSTPSATGTRIFYGVIALLAAVVAPEVLAAGRALSGRIHLPVVQRLIWALAAILVFGGAVRVGPAPAVGTAAIVLGLLFAVVAYASRPVASPERAVRGGVSG
jgi:hypothetical protein